MDLEQKAIERLKLGSQVSLAHYEKPLLLTYSGGKDSDVCLELAQRAGIPFEVCHSLTTADAPQTIQHVKKKFAMLEAEGTHCKIIYPTYKGKRTSMWRLIEEKLMPPTRCARYCCAVLKETAGNNRAIITGVRWDESNSRSNRGEFEVLGATKKSCVTVMPKEEEKQLYLSDEFYLSNDNDLRRQWMENCMKQRKTTCNPIIDWPNHVLWDYIHAENIEINPLYQCGFHRVGCIGCPIAGGRYFAFQRFPKYEIMYKHAFARMLKRRKFRPGDNTIWGTADDVWNWWMNDKNLDGQIEIGDV